MKIGLVLEGGAMRGMFTAGVIDVMMENQIPVDGIIGVSAGAAFGCNYKSNQPGRAIRYNMKYCNDPRYVSFRSLLKTGDIYGAEFCYHELPEKLDVFDTQAFSGSPIEFYLVCTDVVTGTPVYHRCDKGNREDLDWFRASASMPLVSKVVRIGEERLLDGGMSDSIPLEQFESMGFEKNIVVLTQPLGYLKKKNRVLPLIRMSLRKYPKAIETIAHRHKCYNKTTEYIAKQEAAGKAFVIRPAQPLNIGYVEHHPEKLKEIYDIGRRTGEEALEQIRAFVEKNHSM